MKKRTTSQRNILGAFLGGVLGIIALGFLHPIALPFGCFLGVIGGWWYQEIWATIRQAVVAWKNKAQDVLVLIRTFVLIKPKKFKNRSLNIDNINKKIQPIFSSVAWLFRSPILFVRWLKKSKKNRAYILRGMAIITFLLLNFIWIVPLTSDIFARSRTMNGQSGWFLLQMLSGLLIPALTFFVPLLFFGEDSERGHENRFVDLAYFEKHGILFFYGKELFQLLLYQIKVALRMVASLVSSVFIWSMVTSFIFIPLSILVGVVKGIYRVANKSEYWLCFGATLATTSVCAWYAYQYFNNPYVIWFTALTAGVASAALTEGIRRVLVWVYKTNTPVNAIATKTWFEQLAPAGRYFVGIHSKVDNRLANALPL